MKKALLAAAVAAAVVLPTTVASAATPRPFTCTGTISRYYSKQTVNGTLTRATPTNVSVLSWQDAVLVTTPTPKRTNGWWGGYWKSAYNMDQWNVGRDASRNRYHLMLPPAPIGATFEALLVSEFDAGGNWQNWMSCTAG